MSLSGKPTIYNLTLINSGTEYSQALPEQYSKIMIKCRTSVAIQLAYTSGQSGSIYVTIPADQTYFDDEISSSGSVYLQSGTSGVVAEILVWSGA